MKNLITSLSFFVILSSLSIGYSQVVVSATKMNVLYRGCENPLEFAVSGWDNKDLSISVSDDHKLTQQEDGSFIIVPSGNSKIAKIFAKGKMPDGSIRYLGSSTFIVKRIPDPTPWWGGCSHEKSFITIKEIQALGPVVAKMSADFMFQVKPKVKSFSLQVIQDGWVKEERSDSPYLTPSMQELLMRVRSGSGDYIRFFDIYVNLPDGIHPVADLKLTVE